jgi:hypothetical protein
MNNAMSVLLALSLATLPPQTPTSSRAEAEIMVARYVTAVGGPAAIAAIASRVTRGMFDNGRGMVEPFVTFVKAPDHFATHIGRKEIGDAGGSGRASDGRIGWDKNFVGTGLRDLSASEIAEVRRSADPFRPAHLVSTCTTVAVEERRDPAAGQVLRCELPEGTERWSFNAATGLVDRLDITSRAGRVTTIFYEDYRRADGVLTPFRERIVLPGAKITYAASSIRFNEVVPDDVFARPAR